MSTTESLESLHEVLAPLGVLRTENEDLGDWIHDSFAALEKLHEELTQWQSELARKETELNLRADALEKSPRIETEIQHHLAQLEEELEAAKEEARKLEEENAEQILEFEGLKGKYAQIELDLHTSHERIRQLEASLKNERQRSESDRELWQEEFRQLRTELDNYYERLSAQLEKSQIAKSKSSVEESTTAEPDPKKAVHSPAKSDGHRQRDQSRRKSKN